MQKVKDLGIQNSVIFMGYRNDVNNLMQAFDVFLMPSLYEGLPVVGIEAQAAGLPCFMSKDVITEEVGIADNVKFISLNDSAEKWANIVLASDLTRKNNEKSLKNAGYFIDNLIKELTAIYMSNTN